jgi:transposase
MNIFIVINSNKKRMNILTQELLDKSERIVSSILNALSLGDELTYMSIYSLFNIKPNIEFL